MWVPLSFEDLENELNASLVNVIQYSWHAYYLFKLLMNTGLRVSEVLNTEKWTWIEGEAFEVELSKSSGTRMILEEDVPDQIIEFYQGQLDFHPTDYQHLGYTFDWYFPNFRLALDSGNVKLHVFRYYFCQKLNALGFDASEIQDIIHHTKLSTTQNYINTVIHKYEHTA